MLILRARDGVHTKSHMEYKDSSSENNRVLIPKEELMQTGKQKENKRKTVHYSK